VETPEQRDYLLGLGCRLQQGYLLGRPMAAERLLALMEEREAEALA
jgi:EAL domain-containing protein (putative c-di-GMP-specific phosphodiesterase class I)